MVPGTGETCTADGDGDGASIEENEDGGCACDEENGSGDRTCEESEGDSVSCDDVDGASAEENKDGDITCEDSEGDDVSCDEASTEENEGGDTTCEGEGDGVSCDGDGENEDAGACCEEGEDDGEGGACNNDDDDVSGREGTAVEVVCDNDEDSNGPSDEVGGVELVRGIKISVELAGGEKKNDDEEKELVKTVVVSVENVGDGDNVGSDGGMEEEEEVENRDVAGEVGTTTNGVEVAVDDEEGGEGVGEDTDGRGGGKLAMKMVVSAKGSSANCVSTIRIV